MFSKLKRKFILITMISILLVLTTIIGTINIFNYQRVADNADSILNLIEQNNGSLDEFDFKAPQPFNNNPKDFNIINPETKYETRFFTVNFDQNHTIEKEKIFVDYIASINADEAYTMANEVLENNKNKGNYGDYRYLVSYKNMQIIFVDIRKEKTTADLFLYFSILISVIGTLIVLLLVFILSSKIVAPLAKNYEKQKIFITDASHELKTPLTIISANNELNEIEIGENEQTKAISKQVSKMNSLIKSLTTLASISENNQELTFSEFDFSKEVEEVLDSFKPLFVVLKKNYEVNIEENIMLNGNLMLVKHLISLLIENASKYSISYVKVNIYQNKKKINISVLNDADNITEEDLSECFERFNRSNEIRSKIEGSGIGLSIAKEIVNTMHGKINAIGNIENKTFEIQIVL